jgi:hypothetical protein
MRGKIGGQHGAGRGLTVRRVAHAASKLEGRIRWYIARETARRYGPLESRLPEKLQRNIRRNLKAAVPREDVLAWAQHYKDIYVYGRRILPRFLRPPAGRYADVADVRLPGFLGALRRRYRQEPRAVLEMIAWYLVFYEHLK